MIRNCSLRNSLLQFSSIILVAGAILFLSACKPKQSSGTRYDFKGKVVSVDKRANQVIIAHEEIKGFMSAMIMPFTIKDDWAMDVLVPGDQITATLVVDKERSWLEGLVIAKESTHEPGADKTEGLPEPKSGDGVPNFSLINQDDKPIHLANYDGKALVLTFIYTRCPLPEYCTLMSNNFAEIDKQLQKQPEMYAKTHLLSISFDPEYDTPKVLRSYGASHTGRFADEKFDHWEFATGSKDQIKEIAQFFGLRYWSDGEQIVHALRTAIITPDGKILKVYRDNTWKPDEVMEELTKLLSSTK
jgi:protein SCO1/2